MTPASSESLCLKSIWPSISPALADVPEFSNLICGKPPVICNGASGDVSFIPTLPADVMRALSLTPVELSLVLKTKVLLPLDSLVAPISDIHPVSPDFWQYNWIPTPWAELVPSEKRLKAVFNPPSVVA